ncbi:hypothetical protein H0X09_00585 [Candidatus Saccharibacteria bacterium]|nr:hypothetical protein [Candidatus Saccharibacteria bacterium]
MKPATILRYILLPVVVFTVGAKAGVEYAKHIYVSRDREFIEGKVITKNG